MRRWKSLRDSFIRAIKAGKKYKHADHLKFLNNNVNPKTQPDTDSDIPAKKKSRCRKR